MKNDFLKLMLKKQDNELEEYVINNMAYSRDIVEAAIAELKNRGRVFTDTELSTIETKLQERENTVGKNTIIVSDKRGKKLEFNDDEKTFLKKHTVNILRITPTKQAKALINFFFHIALYTITFIYLKFDTVFFLIFLPMAVLLVLPALFLHIEYVYRNKNEEYELCGDKIKKRKDANEFVYDREDIEKVEIYMSPNYFNKDTCFTAFANYHFAKVLLKSGETLYLTSLLDPDGIDKAFSLYLEGISYCRIKRVFTSTLF